MTARFWGDGWDGATSYLAAQRAGTSPVGSFTSNQFGLHDMLGNVWEWCADRWHEDYQGAPTDGSVWIGGGDTSRRVVRGGAWDSYPKDLRVGVRVGDEAVFRSRYVGFRLARTL